MSERRTAHCSAGHPRAAGYNLLQMRDLGSSLNYEPRELKFGTSGRRGEVVHLTQLEVYINALGELEYLQSLPTAEGGIARGGDFYFAYDLRPSSTAFVTEQGGRGEIAQAIVRAIADAGMRPVNLGRIPTPAVACYALERHRGCMMVTGSHIPFDRNGYKTYSARGELLKRDEAPVNASAAKVRAAVYSHALAESPFDESGMFRTGHQDLPPEEPLAEAAYIERYTRFFAGLPLDGVRLLAYQHSSVGRDILVDIVEQLGARVVTAGRSDTFVPIDTENIDAATLAAIQSMVDDCGPVDAVVSADGDADRPLVLAVGPDNKVQFLGGDLLGMLVAEYLGADAVVVPISCNDAIDRGPLAPMLEPKTRIGSPYVIAGMERARSRGKRSVCGWEANGGFLTGSDFERDGRVLRALPTRDAVLPGVAALAMARQKRLTLAGLFQRLPRRFSRAALLKNFPRSVAQKIVAAFSPATAALEEAVSFSGEMAAIRQRLECYFGPALGFHRIAKINYMDGVRITFENGDVAHLRPSGNADELRIYAVADSQSRADFIAGAGVAEPGGILRRMERGVA